MQLAARMLQPVPVDPIAWVLIELRGARAAAVQPFDVLEVRAHADHNGRALVHQGRAWGGLEPVRRHTTWLTDELFLLDDAEPARALRDARQGVNELVATVDGAAPFLSRFAQPIGTEVPREASSVEVLLRRASGQCERYVLPLASAPAALGDALSAARYLSNVARRYFRAHDTPQR